MSKISEQIGHLKSLQEAMQLDQKLGRVKCSGSVLENRIKIIQEAIDTIELLSIKVRANNLHNGWILCDEKMPNCEEEVYVLTTKGTVTTAMYEDGTMADEDSAWNWNDIEYEYDEESDTFYIPEGWWEYRHFNPDDVYNNCVDEIVVAWQPLPERLKLRFICGRRKNDK